MESKITRVFRIQFLLYVLVLVLGNSSSRMTQGLAQTASNNVADSSTAKLPDVTFTAYDYEQNQAKWPISIKQVLIGNREIQLGKPVPVSGNWLGSVKVIVQNTSPRPIVYGTMVFSFPETGSGQQGSPIFTTIANLGRFPDIGLLRHDGTKATLPAFARAATPISIAPGGQMEFDLTTNQADRPFAYNQAGGQITKVTVLFQDFYFADNTKWTAETYFSPTGTPGQWQIIPAQQFSSSTQPEH
jgi:hypothetical protein